MDNEAKGGTMKNRSHIRILVRGLIFLFFLITLTTSITSADPLGENREVIFSGEGAELAQKAAELGSPAAIYEYVRNTHEYALYHGSRSNSINTFGGMRGSDVDIASVLIAMYRSQNIPARYAVGTVSIPATDVTNWLGVKDIDLAAAIMDDQGIQNVAISPDRQFIEFEHVWVQAQVPFDNYRGAFASTTDCTATPDRCNWIDLDPSYKLREHHNQNIDVYGAVNFNYDRYYNAIKTDDTEYRDKGPLEIYEEQILEWLKVNHPGKTLDDVADPGTIITEEDGILPASLPYQVTSGVQTYDSIADHDAANDPDWAKYLNGSFHIEAVMSGGGTISITTGIGGPHALADLSTKRLTVTYSPITVNGVADRVEVRLDGDLIATPFQSSGSLTFPLWTPFSMDISLDGAPATEVGQPDNKIEVTYSDMVVGGYYLIGTGGDTSNWSQVHRAADQLLQANETYQIINDANDVPYVDQNGNGVVDGPDTPLLDTPDAQDALTGGLLYVAMSQYFTKFVEGVRQLDTLNHIISPIEGFVGVVSSTYEVDYLGDTAFSVMPGGLLIDMKGQSFTGAWRVDAPSTFANSHFELLGHHVSSLEHEIWQELTGFDAVSTVRGIQMALAAGHSLLTPENTGSGNNMAAQYSGFQFNNSIPSGFTYTPFTVFSTQPATWTHTTEGAQMEILKREVDATTSSQRRAKATYDFHSTSGLYGWVECVDYWEQALWNFYNANGNVSISPITLCLNTYSGPVLTVIDDFEYDYFNTIIPDMIGQSYFNFFDRAQGFNPNDHVYRALPLTTNQHSGSRVQDIRDDVMIGDEMTFSGQNGRWAYVIPGRKTEGEVYRFSVYLEKITDPTTGHLASQSYSIANYYFSASGGWVDGTQTLEAATAIPGTSVVQPTFNNEVFTDQNLVAQTNNDLIRTPSTADPVSTVTGNMYHDETDFTIKGRGLDYAFTRSYNSAPVRTGQDGPFGYGWTHSYNMSLRSNDYGDCPNCTQTQAAENNNGITSSITYIDERGGEHTYILNADGSGTRAVAENPPGEFDTLALNSPASGQFTLTFRNGVKYVFSGSSGMVNTPDQTARLDYIEDPYNNRLTMGYDGYGRLDAVTDNLGISGRTGLVITYYGTTSHIATITDWTNRQWQYGYDGSGNLTTVTTPESSITYTYHPDSHLVNEIILPADRSGQQVKTAFSYYRNNKAFSYANTLGETETLDYDLYRQRTRVTDPRGFVREHFYDRDNGALVKLKEPDGAILLFANNDDGLRYEKSDALGYTTQYSYLADRSVSAAASTTNGLVSREIDSLEQQTDYNYGIFDQPTSTVDKRGNTITRLYCSSDTSNCLRGKLRRIRATVNGQAGVNLTYYTYYADAGLPNFGQIRLKREYIDPADTSQHRDTKYVYESNGLNLRSLTVSGVPSGGSVNKTFTYDSLGRLETETLTRRTSATDSTPMALTTTYEYDDLDRVIRVTSPRGDIHETVYDANGQVYQEKVHHKQPGGGYVTRTYATHAYDAADRRVSTTDILGNTTTFAYDEAGNLISQTDANGHTTRYEYDAMNRRTAIIDANGHRSEMKYDLGGRLIETKDANGNVTSYEYDALGRQTKVITAMGLETQMQYDAGGNPTHLTDANAVAGLQPKNDQNASVYREYDELNRLTLVRDAANGDTLYTYDLLGNITSIADAEDQVTTFIYDALGRLIETVDPVTESPDKTDRVLMYDQAGNVLLTEDHTGRQRRHTYDALNRRTLTEYLSDGTSDGFVYDAFGDLVQVANNEVTYTYTYTPRHELASKTDDRLNKTLSWTYDPVGNVESKTDYQNEVTEYQYDSTNRLVALRNQDYLQVSYHYDGAGRLIDRILSNGAKTTYRYDDDNRMTGLKNSSADGTVVEDLTYSRDNIGNITQVADAISGRIVDYTYDPLYRLTDVNSTDNSEDRAYTYDGVGNRLTITENGTTYYYAYSVGNRLTNIRTGSISGSLYRQFSYDDAGRILEKQNGSGAPIYSVTYNGKGRAEQIVNSGTSHYFSYDPNDYRIEKNSKFYHLEGEHLEAVYSSSGTLQEKYLRGVVVDEIVNGYRYHSSDPNDWTNYTFHHDHLNSITAMTGHAGSIEETFAYDAFGEPIGSTGSNSMLYTGREYDSETGLYYYRARYYDPEIGRFITEDPLGFEAGINFYAYVGNNPVNFNDPSGNLVTPDTILDLGFIAYDIYSFAKDPSWGNAAALGLDVAGALLPGATGLGAVYRSSKLAPTGTFLTEAATQAVKHVDTAGMNARTAGREMHTFAEGFAGSRRQNLIIEQPYLNTNAINYRAKGSSVPDVLTGTLDNPTAAFDFKFGDKGITNAWETKLRSNLPASSSGIPVSEIRPYTGGYQRVTGSGAAYNFLSDYGSSNSSAGGGFVLYPSKPNTNMMQSVYAK